MDLPTNWVPDDVPEWEPPTDEFEEESSGGYDWGDLEDDEDDQDDDTTEWGWPA